MGFRWFQLVSRFKPGWVAIFLNAQSLAIRAVAEAFGSVSLAVLPSQGHSALTKSSAGMPSEWSSRHCFSFSEVGQS